MFPLYYVPVYVPMRQMWQPGIVPPLVTDVPYVAEQPGPYIVIEPYLQTEPYSNVYYGNYYES